MTPQNLSTTVQERIDQAEAADGALRVAVSAFYDLTGRLEQLDAELFSQLDGAWVECLFAIRRVAWLDGFACGRDPLLLATFAPKEGAQ